MTVIKNKRIMKCLLMMVVSLLLVFNFSIGVSAIGGCDRQEADACITISQRLSVKGGSSTGKVPGRVQSRINIAKGQTRYTPLDKNGNVIDAGWNHVVKRHFNGELSQGTSKFTITQDELKKILQSDNTVSATVKSLDDGQFVRTVDTGQIIGNTSLKYGGGPTSWIKVFTDKAGNIITTYPIPEP